MKIYQYFMGVKPYMQLLALLIMSVVFLIIGSFVSALFMPLFVPLDDIVNGGVAAVNTNVSFMRFLQGSTQICYMLVPSLLFGMMFHERIDKFFKLRFSRKQIVITIYGVLTFVVMIPFIDTLTTWNNSIHLPESMAAWEIYIREMGSASEAMVEMFLTEKGNTSIFVANIVVMALIPAVCEEFIFRGAIQQTCDKWFRNHHVAILVTAAVFSLIHFDLFNFIPRFVMGVLLGYLFYYSGTIWTSVFVHFVNNGLIVVLYHFLGYSANDTVTFGSTALNILLVVLSIVASVLLMYAGIRSMKNTTMVE
ncbi:MAG: CPBP family intramembrane metalloprotease [Bacteroidales bacterium]|nr:CPBP family intramembrane metalloprotease [Bacteroidales bacterium]